MDTQSDKQRPDVVEGDFVYLRGTSYSRGGENIFPWWTLGKQYEVVVHCRNGLGVYADDGDFYPINGEALAGDGYFEKVDTGDISSQPREWATLIEAVAAINGELDGLVDPNSLDLTNGLLIRMQVVERRVEVVTDALLQVLTRLGERK